MPLQPSFGVEKEKSLLFWGRWSREGQYLPRFLSGILPVEGASPEGDAAQPSPLPDAERKSHLVVQGQLDILQVYVSETTQRALREAFLVHLEQKVESVQLRNLQCLAGMGDASVPPLKPPQHIFPGSR